MHLLDQFGNSVSTRSREALEHYDRAASLFSLYRIDPVAAIDAAIEADPTFVMAHCFKASMLTTTSERGAEPAIAACLDAAERNAGAALDRERRYIAAGRAWLRGDFVDSVRLHGEIAAEHPRDLTALQVAHIGDFLLGQASMLRDRPAQVLHAWGKIEAARGIVLGMHAFGLEETGDYARAEAAGRRAVEMEPRDGWGAHAVAHVCEMQGRTQDGMAWLRATSPGWSADSFFASHNWWHLALFMLDEGDPTGVLGHYDTRVRTRGSKVALEMVDASALLWRLRMRGIDAGERWDEIADCWESSGEEGYYAFNDVHALMAYLATGRERSTRRVIRALEAAAARTDTNAVMSRDVGLPVARALESFERRDYDVALEALMRVRGFANRFGGSHAQRDLLNLTLTEAALRADRPALARALVEERLALKPASPFNLTLARRARDRMQDASRAA